MKFRILKYFFLQHLFLIVLFVFQLNLLAQKNAIVESIEIVGNKKTKPHIILREFAYKVNDTIETTNLKENIEQSRKNLLNTSLFNFVTITQHTADSLNYTFIIDVTERWYTWPNPIFELADRNLNSWWEKRDFSRTNYGFYIEQQNFRGRMETLKLLLRFGYDEQYAMDYNIPYINKKQTFGMGINGGLKRNHEIAHTTFDNQLEFIKNKEKHLHYKYYGNLRFSLRNQIFEQHIIQVGYEYNQIDDTVLALNPYYSENSLNTNKFFTASYYYKNDHRDIKAYPLKGYYFDFSFTKLGLGLVKHYAVNTYYFKTSLRKYWHLHNRFYSAASLDFKLSENKRQPYFVMQALGYGRQFVRGYEYYVIDGQHFGMFKSNFKFNWLKTQQYNIPFIPTPKFSKIHIASFLNTYFDAAYVTDKYYAQNNSFTNTWIWGFGVGLDLITYYDKVVRFEFSQNKIHEQGFFIHLIAPI